MAAGGVVVLGAGAGAALAGCSSGSGATSSAGTPAATSSSTSGINTTNPKPGGALNIGVFSEIDGFYPPSNHFDQTGFLYAMTVYDPLFWTGADGSVAPYLAESISSDSTYQTWTMKLRPGVKFSDGSDLTAAVVLANFNAFRSSALTGPALAVVTDTSALDDLTVQFRLSTTYPTFPFTLTSQVGFVVGQAMIDAFSAGKTANPIGTGPFIFQSWEPNDHFTATKNPNYWRSGYPYLDQVTFHPIPDTTQRQQSLRAGNVDVMLSADASTIGEFEGQASQFPSVNSITTIVGEPTLSFIMLNCEATPTDDLRIRQALAMATEVDPIQAITKLPIKEDITGLFLENSKYHNTTSYPQYDPAQAKKLVTAYAAEKGTPKIELQTINNPIEQEVVQVLQQMWEEVGFEVTLTVIQQAALIDNFVSGSFQAVTDQQFGAVDPALNYVWLSTTTISSNGSIGLNFARNNNPTLQQFLEEGRSLSNGSARVKAFQGVNEELAKDVPYVWLGRAAFSVTALNRVQNFAGLTLPDGSKGYGFDEGVLFPSQIWLS